MRIRILDTPEQIAKEAADIFAAEVKKKPDCVFGFATGATPVLLYTELADRCKSGDISFKDVTTFNLDEYCDLPVSDKNSYYTFMHENFFNKIDIKEENVHLPDGNAKDVEAHCKAYDEAIKNAGGLDIQLLGVGTNGHIGFNEPAKEFSKGTFKVELTESTIKSNSIYFDENQMPRSALTMGIDTIMSAEKIVFIATGENKADAVRKMLQGKVTPLVPASILQKHKDAVIFIDKAAASML